MRKVLFLISITVLLVFTACEKSEKLESYPSHVSKLVANCYFSPDTSFDFRFSKSLSPLDNSFFKAMTSPSAYVKLWENDILIDSFRCNSRGVFSGNRNFKPNAGKKYRFESHYPGFPVLNSESVLPFKSVITSSSGKVTLGNAIISDTIIRGHFNYSLALDLDPTILNKYLIISIRNDFTKKSINSIQINNLKDLYPANISNFSLNKLYIKNENGINKIDLSWDDQYGAMSKNNKSNHLIVELKSCSEAIFEYLRRSDIQQENLDDPFAEPTPISNNIINGFGVFGASNSTYFKISY